MGIPFDRDGLMAARGGISSIVYRLILQSDFYQRPEPRTTGREDFSSDWVDRIAQESGLKAYDLLASAVDAVARIIADAISRHAIEHTIKTNTESNDPSRPDGGRGGEGGKIGGGILGGIILGGVILAGGGAKHHLLVRQIQHHLADQWQVILSDTLGIPLESREAMGMAVLGTLSMDGVAITWPSVTGATSPSVAGCLTLT